MLYHMIFQTYNKSLKYEIDREIDQKESFLVTRYQLFNILMHDMTQKLERFLMKYHQPPLHMNVVSKLNILITHKRTQAKNTSVLGYRKRI